MRLLEILSDIFFQDRRRERPERFALFDARVEHLLHFGAARIDYDRSIAERARPEFHPPLKPTDNQALSYVARRAPGHVLIGQSFVWQADAIKFCANLCLAKLRSGVRGLHYFDARLPKQLMPDLITNSQRGAAVACRRLHKHASKRSVEQNLSIHH